MTTVLTGLIPGRYWIVVVDDDGDEIWLESYASRSEAQERLQEVASLYPNGARIERDM